MDRDKSGVKFATFSFSGREEIVHVVDTCLEQNREIRSSKTNFVHRMIINKMQTTCSGSIRITITQNKAIWNLIFEGLFGSGIELI